MLPNTGSLTSSQPSEQTDLHMTASDASNSVGRQPEVTVMEQDQQSVAPAPASQQQNQNPARGPGMSHSSSAPDLRLMLATELPDNRPMFLPVPGSYAGALVPYKSPEVQPGSPCTLSSFLPLQASSASSGLGRLVLVLLQGDMLY